MTVKTVDSPHSDNTSRNFMLEDCARSGLTEEQVIKLNFKPVDNGYLIPYLDPETEKPMTTPDGRPFERKRLMKKTDSGAKYISPKNGGIRCYVPPETHRKLIDHPDIPLYLTEGEKKAAKASFEGLPVIGLGGIWNWLQKGKTGVLNADLIPYVKGGRDVIIIYDSDATETPKKAAQFDNCATRLALALEPYGATLYRVDLPKLNGCEKVGLDDWFIAGENWYELDMHISLHKKPIPLPKREIVNLGDSWLDIIRKTAGIVEPRHEIFFRSGEIVRLAIENDMPHFEPLTPIQACSELERFCIFEKPGRNGAMTPTRLSEGIARPVIGAPEFARRMPKIKRLADYPMPIMIDDKIHITKFGYDPKSETFTDTTGPEPEEMTIEEALVLLEELLSGFCFAEIDGDNGEFCKLNAVMYLLTCHCRLLIEPERAPIFYAGGNREGVGKDYLLGLGPILTSGGLPPFTSPTRDQEETRKRILTICRSGARFFLISNVKGHLDDAALEQAATSPVHTDRVLGKSEDLTFPNTAVYCISGNQLSYSGDLARRMIPIELAYFGETVEERRFKHPDLYAYLLRNRAKYLGALQAMVNRWRERDCMLGTKNKASFVRWAQVVGGIMEACDLPNPINEGPRTTTPNEETEQFARLLSLTYEKHGDHPLVSKELQTVAMENELFGWLGDMETERRAQTRFGMILKKMEQRRFSGLCIVADRSAKRTRWQVKGDA